MACSRIRTRLRDACRPNEGYRFFAADVLERLESPPRVFELELAHQRTEIDLALQATTEKLATATRLLALVSGPPLEATTVRHAEVLLLQPELVMVVVITSTGGVTKRMFDFEQPVDAGIAGLGARVPERAHRRRPARQPDASRPPRRPGVQRA